MTQSEYTILIDQREKRPLKFPDRIWILDPAHLPHKQKRKMIRLRTKKVTLQTADYVLGEETANCYTVDGYTHGAVIERKFGVDEIALNTLDARRRTLLVAEFERLRRTWARPLLIFEGGLSALYTPTKRNPHPELAASALLRLCFEYGIMFIPVPSSTTTQRQRLSLHVAQLLVNGAIANESPR